MTVRIAAAFALSLAFAGAFAGNGLAQTRANAAPAVAGANAAGKARDRREKNAGQGSVLESEAAEPRPRHGDRLLPARLPARRRRIAGRRPELAGDAAVAQPQLGPSGTGQIPRALRAARRQGDRLARHPGRRHGAAARRPAAVRPCEPSDRARRRHLVHADAGPRIEPERARGHFRQQSGRSPTDCTSTRRPGRRPTSPSSRPRPSSPRSSAFWSMPRSRRNCAASRTRATTPGWRRCGPGTAMPTTSTCG